jgi:hypothetical protein
MERIASIIKKKLPYEHFDVLGVGIIDFNKKSYETIEANTFENELKFKREPFLYFDLASLTKVLTNSLSYFLKPEAFDQDTLLALNHRAGLPAWGLLARDSWKKQILSYSIKESPTLYSDFSALRVQLELQKNKIDMKALCQTVWDNETYYWLDLPQHYPTAQCGFKNGRPNYGQVHDPNAWTLNTFCSHAGVFSTVDGLCRTLLSFQEKTHFVGKVKTDLSQHRHRFSFGWDRVENTQDTLAGAGCGPSTFGHLGFTGTSIWIDPDRMVGHVILSNAVKNYWYDKKGLNELRRTLGETIWNRYSLT